MPEYTVRRGDTLWRLAQRYATTPEAIRALSGLRSDALQVGQRLVIPAYTEAEVRGDRTNIRNAPGPEGRVIAQMNTGARLPVIGGTNEWLLVRLFNGQRGWINRGTVRLRPHTGRRPIVEVLGFYTEEEGPGLPSSEAVFRRNVRSISDIGLFHFRLDRQNPTQIEKFFEFTDSYMRELVRFGHGQNIKMLPVIHNLLYERGNPEVNKEVVGAMLRTPQTRATAIANMIALARRYNFDGIHIDFEDVNMEDSGRLSAFYRELGAALDRERLYMAVSTPSRISDQPTSAFSAPFDYAVIGAATDEFVAMLYNEHGWPGSGPGPVVSIGWMERVLRYAMTKMPASKITAAVSVFGFDFNLRTDRATYVTYTQAMNRAGRYGVEVRFDEATQTPMFAYTDDQGVPHEVWFENADSIRAKMNLAAQLGIRGLALWRLGMEDPAMWPMLEENFVIRKSVT